MAPKKIAAKIPAGFSEVNNALAGFWKPTVDGQWLQGIVGHMIEGKGQEGGKPNRFFAVRITNPESAPIMSADDKPVALEGGELVGVGGAILVSFLAERVGSEVYLVYKGLGRAKRGQNAPKLYATYAKDYDPETGEVPL
jgi:hypothetical protein